MKLKIIKDYNLAKISKPGFVVGGDIHLYNSYPFSIFDELNMSSRLVDVNSVLINAVDCASKFGVPLIINGDFVTGRRLGHAVLSMLIAFKERVAKKKVNVIINTGNHDWDGPVTMLEPIFRDSERINLITKPTTMPIQKNVLGYFIPFDAVNRVKIALNRLIEADSEGFLYKVLYLHMPLKGAKHGVISSETGLPQKMFRKNGIIGRNFDLVVVSHFHRYQKIAGGHGFYTSSLLPIDFGEKEDEHGYHLVSLKKKKHYFICPKGLPRFKVIKLDNVLKSKQIKGNYIKVDASKPDFTLLEERRVHKALLKKGAKAIVFNKVASSKPESKLEIDDDATVEDLVREYATIKAKNVGLDLRRIEDTGISILNEANETRVLSSRLSDT